MKNLCRIVVLALTSVVPWCHAQPAGLAHANLQAEALVEGRVISLGDVAQLSGSDQVALDALRRVQLAIAPQPGFSLHLTRREVLRLLREAGSQNVELEGAEATIVIAAATPFESDRIVTAAKEILAATLLRDGQTLELTLSEALPSIRLPRGDVTLRARAQAADRPRRQMTAWVDILLDGRFYRSIPVQFAVAAKRRVFVARSDLNKGLAPTCANLDLELRDVAQLASPAQTGDCADLGRRLRRNLPAGEVLASAELEAIPAVSEGDFVTLEVTEGAVKLESRAVALTDGQVGQRIQVRATLSQEAVLAMVVAPGVVNLYGK